MKDLSEASQIFSDLSVSPPQQSKSEESVSQETEAAQLTSQSNEQNAAHKEKPKKRSTIIKIEIRQPNGEKDKLRLRNYLDIRNFEPQKRVPTPKSLRIRLNSQWWVRCVSNEIISANFCHSSFMERNALSDKKHPCYKCSLGKYYRLKFADDNYRDERLETFERLS